MLNNVGRKLLWAVLWMIICDVMVQAREDKLLESETPFGIRATNPRLDSLYKDNCLVMPPAQADGNLPTLNTQGFQTPETDSFSDEWVVKTAHYASLGLVSVDIGAAYGLVTRPALDAGGIVVANDIDFRHLLLLRELVPADQRRRLYLNNQRFPSEMNFTPGTIGSIILRRVLHFATPEEMEKGLNKMCDWLPPGGSVTIITMSPYHYSLSAFLPEYEKRWELGSLWPGEISNMHEYRPDLEKQIPQYLHVMDERPLRAALEKRGFRVENSGLFDFDHSKDKDHWGRGYFGIRAVKLPN